MFWSTRIVKATRLAPYSVNALAADGSSEASDSELALIQGEHLAALGSSGHTQIDTFAIDATNIYWGGHYGLVKVPLAGGTRRSVVKLTSR